jgi:hypothetical protein
MVLEFVADARWCELVGGLFQRKAEDMAAHRTSPTHQQTAVVISRHEFAVFVLPRHDCFVGRPVSERGNFRRRRVEKMLVSAVEMSGSSIAAKSAHRVGIQGMVTSLK